MLKNAWQLIFQEKYQLVVNYKPVKCFITFLFAGYLLVLIIKSIDLQFWKMSISWQTVEIEVSKLNWSLNLKVVVKLLQ